MADGCFYIIADVDMSSGISIWWCSHLKLPYSSAVVPLPALVPPLSAFLSSGSSALNTPPRALSKCIIPLNLCSLGCGSALVKASAMLSSVGQ
ncbi:hypothetical protein BDR06DRAFT_179436 [Suillus hirtellus]|nr:hypothetical protein BDR06DRAFT_179436 [Suillus hirtellus]